jgi:hypothetical protein
MLQGRKVGSVAGILLILLMALAGCAEIQTTGKTEVRPDSASLLYLLTTAGFQRWEVNDETPRRQALLTSLPPGKIVAYKANGGNYYVYADDTTGFLYAGTEDAYQKYLSLSQGRKLCERVEGPNHEAFWRCFEEYQTVGPRPRGK